MMSFDVRLVIEAQNKKEAVEKASRIGFVRSCIRTPKLVSKSSASRSERLFAEFLSEWLGGKVVRSPGSGSMKECCGDFVGVEPKSAEFFSTYCVELKTIPSAKYSSVLDRDFLKFHDEVISKTFRESYNLQKVPVVIFKAKRFECVSVPWKLAMSLGLPFLLKIVDSFTIAIVELSNFFNKDPIDLKLLASEVLESLTSEVVHGIQS